MTRSAFQELSSLTRLLETASIRNGGSGPVSRRIHSHSTRECRFSPGRQRAPVRAGARPLSHGEPDDAIPDTDRDSAAGGRPPDRLRADSGPTAETAPGLTAESHTAEHSSTTYTFEDDVGNPCNGETVHLTTVGVQQTNVVDGGGGVLHYELQLVEDITGTGPTTGASYRSHNVSEESFNSPTVAALNFTYTFREESYVMLGTTPGVSFRAGALFHSVALPSGEFKITRDLESLDCRG